MGLHLDKGTVKLCSSYSGASLSVGYSMFALGSERADPLSPLGRDWHNSFRRVCGEQIMFFYTAGCGKTTILRIIAGLETLIYRLYLEKPAKGTSQNVLLQMAY